jgi:GT2 family glycosyltransferase
VSDGVTVVMERTDTSVAVTVIVCSYTLRRWSLLERAITSLEDQTVAPERVVLVTDHCAPLERRARERFPDVTVVSNTGGRGLSEARNTGLAHAGSDVVAFLDDDAVAAPGWIAALCAGYTDEDVLGVGGQVDPDFEAGRPPWFPPEFDWVVGCSHSGLPGAPAPVRNFVGANMSFRRDVLDDLGGFRSELGRVGTVPVGCEETELCIRAVERNGGRLVYDPGARVRHTVPPERASWSYFRRRCFSEGRSKAVVASLRGSDRALSDERGYVLRTLPRGVVDALRDAIRRPGRSGAAVAIAAGLGATTAGYLTAPATAAEARPGPQPGDLAAAPAPTPRPWRAWVHPVALLAALLCWASSLRAVNLAHMNLGLVSALPTTYWLGLVLLTVSFAALVCERRTPRWLLVAHVVALIAMLHATPAVLYPTLRYAWTWKHVGVVDSLLRSGHVATGTNELAIYKGWPGFFALNAVLTGGTGAGSAASYAAWGPPIFNLLLLPPLLVIFQTFSADRRRVWTAVWLFYLGSWVGQDYFSPQAYDFVLYLTVIALCLRWLPAVESRSRVDVAGIPSGGVQLDRPPRRQVLLIMALLVLAIASTHQLTPVALISALALLWVFRARRCGAVLVLAIVCTVGWAALFGRSFLDQNMHSILASFGQPFGNSEAGLVNASAASRTQALVAQADRFLSAALWMLGLVGLWRRRGSVRPELPLMLLAFAPLPIVVANNYGGEILFRVYMFGLPFVAFFAAAAFFPSAARSRSVSPVRALRTATALGLTCTVLLGAFVFAYYGKEQANYFTPTQVRATNWLYDHAPDGSLIAGITGDLPWGYRNGDRFAFEFLDEDPPELARVRRDPAGELGRLLASSASGRGYLVFARSIDVDVHMRGVLNPGELERIERAVAGSPTFRILYSNRDATVYEVVASTARTSTGGS